MAWEGFFTYAGTEIINAARVEAYAEQAGLPFFQPIYKNASLPLLLEGLPRYTSALQDDAPWVDPDIPESYEFFGVYPLEVSGIEDSTRSSEVVESTKDGGVPGRLRHGTKAVVFNVVLIASTEEGAEYGFRWLKQALLGSPCGDSANSPCNGADLCYLSAQPTLDMLNANFGTPAVPSLEVARNLAIEPRATGTNMYASNNIANWTALWNQTAPGTPPNSLTRAFRSTVATPSGLILSSLYNLDGLAFSPINRGVGAWVYSAKAGTATIYMSDDQAGTITSPAVAVPAGTWTFVASRASGTGHSILSVTSNTTAVTGDQVFVTGSISKPGAAPTAADYFNGEYADVPGFEYMWTGTPDLSASIKVNVAVPAVPADDFEECLTPYLRTLRKVLVNRGPIVTGKREPEGGVVWTATFTAVAGVPFEFGADIPVVEGFGDPTVTNPYPGGVIPDGGYLDLEGDVVQEVDCAVKVYAPVFDPLNPAVIEPPTVPNIPLGYYVPPENWYRRLFTIPKQMVPLWGEVAPRLEVHAPSTEIRNLRVRFYADPFDIGSTLDDPCAYCGDIVISYVPANHTLIFDGASETVHVLSPGGVLRRADSLVFRTDGSPFEWPRISCGFGYIVTLDLPQQQVVPVVDLALIPRVM